MPNVFLPYQAAEFGSRFTVTSRLGHAKPTAAVSGPIRLLSLPQTALPPRFSTFPALRYCGLTKLSASARRRDTLVRTPSPASRRSRTTSATASSPRTRQPSSTAWTTRTPPATPPCFKPRPQKVKQGVEGADITPWGGRRDGGKPLRCAAGFVVGTSLRGRGGCLGHGGSSDLLLPPTQTAAVG